MNLLALDFETQDDKPQTTRITEVGAAWDFFDGKSKYSEFCWEPDYPKQTPFIADLTGITDEILAKEGVSRRQAFTSLLPLVHRADIIFAHKKAFDQTIFESTCKLLGLEFPKKEWICTLSEVKWPKKFTCKKLGHLAFEYGLFDPPSGFDRTKLHRAGDDSELLLHMMTHKHDLNEVLRYAREPWVYMKAYCIEPWKDGGEQTGIAKRLQFGWERCQYDERQFPKCWVKRVKLSDMEETSKLHEGTPFRISVIEGIN